MQRGLRMCFKIQPIHKLPHTHTKCLPAVEVRGHCSVCVGVIGKIMMFCLLMDRLSKLIFLKLAEPRVNSERLQLSGTDQGHTAEMERFSPATPV